MFFLFILHLPSFFIYRVVSFHISFTLFVYIRLVFCFHISSIPCSFLFICLDFSFSYSIYLVCFSASSLFFLFPYFIYLDCFSCFFFFFLLFFFLPSTSLWGFYSETFIHRYSIPLAHAFTRLCVIFVPHMYIPHCNYYNYNNY